jgi:hypothetical protein
MKTLNRPMFRYGGPIKEGIMDGMREPKKDGNIVGGKQSPLLAGAHPLKDSEGREHHFIPALYAAGLGALNIGRAGLAAARIAGPAIARGFKAARGFGATPGKLGFVDRVKDLARINKGIGLPMATRPESVGFRIGSFAKQNPILTLSAPSLGYDAARIGGPLLAEGAKGVANFLVPGERFDPFKPKQPKVPEGDKTGLKRGTKEEGKTKVVTTPNVSGTGEGTKQEINEDRIQATKDRYYKLMGIDKMNKESVYDSLIDASKIIQQEGGDLKGAIKSGSLQSQLIGAISQNLDKSSALKKQIDAAVLKGEIEKDIKANDPSAAVDLAYKKAATAKIQKDLKGSSAADVLATAEISGKNLVTSNTLTSILQSKGTDVDFTFPDDKFQKWEKNNEGKDEIDYLTENYGGLDNGTYVVNKKAFKVQDGSVFPIDLDSITG